MSSPIEDYALIGNCITAALVGRDGSMDWLPLPRFDSAACFTSLVGDADNGRWQIAPAGKPRSVRRCYRNDTLILETTFVCDGGTVTLIDFMAPLRSRTVDIVRLVRCDEGAVAMHMEAIFRFGYGTIVPWVRRRDDGICAIAGPDAVRLRTPVPLEGRDKTTVGEFTVRAGETVPFVLTWYHSHHEEPQALDPAKALAETETFWQGWSDKAKLNVPAQWRQPVMRSLLTLKALTFAPTGGIVAAPTTSLPEMIGSVRNWDYRYCWLRDATFTLYALIMAGYMDEAVAWRDWLLRAVAGSPNDMRVLYGIGGERQLPELELPWLAGYAGSKPVRIGNAAHTQRQTDIYGEVMDAFYTARLHGAGDGDDIERVQRQLMEYLEGTWQMPDSGIWEIREEDRRHTHSAVMAWVAFDRAISAAEKFKLEGPIDRWRSVRDDIHRQVCRDGFDSERGVFVQTFGGKALDAALLRIPLVGFLPPSDPRVRATMDAVAKELSFDGLVMRYRAEEAPDGLPEGEGAFLICSFWLADNFALAGRGKEARALFERLLSLRNDVGLLAEEYDPRAKRQLGNFPQAFSHVGLINTAYNLATEAEGPAEIRAKA